MSKCDGCARGLPVTERGPERRERNGFRNPERRSDDERRKLPDPLHPNVPADSAHDLALIRAALEAAAKECSHRAFLCDTHDEFGKGKEAGMLATIEYIRALDKQEILRSVKP